MLNSNVVALVFSDGASSGMLREVIREVGCAIAYETSVAAFTPDALAESGAEIVIVDLASDADADSIFDLLGDDRYRVIVNDAEVTRGLTGWDHARWARHLTAKILDLPGVVDPPRPEEAPLIATRASVSTSSKSVTESQENAAGAEKPLSNGSELGIDDWLSDVLQVKDSAGLFAESTPQAPASHGTLGEFHGAPRAQLAVSEFNRTTAHDALSAEEAIPGSTNPVIAEQQNTAAEQSFGWKIDDVIRDIDEWLPPADSSPDSTEPERSARSWSSADTQTGPELELTDPSAVIAVENERLELPAASQHGLAGDMRWVSPVQPATLTMPAASVGIAAMKDLKSGPLAHSLELMPSELAPLTPLSDGQHVKPAEDLDVDVLTMPATVTRVIVLCASVGGPEAIRDLLGAIPASHTALFLVVQQVGEEFLDLLSQQLRRATALRVRSADVGDQVRDGEVIPISPRQRLVIDRSGRVTLNQRVDEVGEAPMKRVLFDVSNQFGEDCTAVILSGVASDAAEGCRYVAERGGEVCAQAPASCVSSGMVEQVQQTGVVSFLGTPSELAAHLLLARR